MGKAYWCGALIFFAALLSNPGQAARGFRDQPPQWQPPGLPDTTIRPPGQSLNRRMLKASYEQIQKDVQQLYKLAGELKEEVAKANEDVLTISGMKKAEKIEKLAKKIRGRMKNL